MVPIVIEKPPRQSWHNPEWQLRPTAAAGRYCSGEMAIMVPWLEPPQLVLCLKAEREHHGGRLRSLRRGLRGRIPAVARPSRARRASPVCPARLTRPATGAFTALGPRGKQQRWSIDVAWAAAMLHRCRLRTGAGARTGEARGARGVRGLRCGAAPESLIGLLSCARLIATGEHRHPPGAVGARVACKRERMAELPAQSGSNRPRAGHRVPA
jgi:hypothetical protein